MSHPLRSFAPALGLLLVAGCGATILGPEAAVVADRAHAPAVSEDASEERDARAWLRGAADEQEQDPVLGAARAELTRALEAHRFGEAVAAAERVLAMRPRDRGALMLMSDALVELGRLDEAEAALQAVLDLRPDGAAYFRAGWLLHLRGEDQAALEALELALEAARFSPPAARAWILTEAADVRRARGELPAAEALYAQALRLNPRWRPARLGLARAALAAGDPWEAVRALEEARPSLEVLGLLARARRAQGQEAAAAEAAARAVAMGVGDAHDGRALALLLSDEGLDAARALRLARAEVAARPGPHAWDALAWALLRAGQAHEALAAAEQALAWGTQEPELLLHAGLAARAAGDPRAAAWLERAAELDPSLATFVQAG